MGGQVETSRLREIRPASTAALERVASPVELAVRLTSGRLLKAGLIKAGATEGIAAVTRRQPACPLVTGLVVTPELVATEATAVQALLPTPEARIPVTMAFTAPSTSGPTALPIAKRRRPSKLASTGASRRQEGPTQVIPGQALGLPTAQPRA